MRVPPSGRGSFALSSGGSDRADTAAPLSDTGLVNRIRRRLAVIAAPLQAQRLAGTALLIRVASAALAFLSQVLLARWMGSYEFGIYVFVWTCILLVGGVVDFGIASSAQRFIPEYTQRKSLDLLRGFLSGSRWIVIGLACAVAVLAAAGIRLAGDRLDDHTIVPLYIACLILPFYALTHIQDAMARSYNWVNLGLLPQYVLRQVALLGLMAAALVGGLAMDATTAMWAFLIAVLITTLGQSLVLNRRVATKVDAGPRNYAPRAWFAVSLPIMLVEAFHLLLSYTDVIILQFYVAPNELAVYYAAAKTLSLVAFIYFSMSATIAHKFTEYHVSGNKERLAAFLAQSIRWTFWPSLAATVLILLLGRPLLSLFGPHFVEGYYLMFLLAVGLLARAAVGPVERLLSMLGEQRICAFVYAVAFVINVVLCVVLIPRLGVAGAAVAISTALVIESILLFIVTKKRLGFRVFVFSRVTE